MILDIEDKIVGCLLGGAIGDALGAAVEGMSANHIKTRYPYGITNYVKYRSEGKESFGEYTDDTQLTILIAESYAKHNIFNPEDFSKELIKWYDYKIGAGPSCVNSALNLKKRIKWTESGDSTSIGNGAAMRSAPVGIYRRDNLKLIEEESKLHSMITHKTNEAIAGSMAVAYAVAYCLNHDKIDVNDFLEKTAAFVALKSLKLHDKILLIKKIKNPASAISMLGNSGLADETVASSLYYFTRNPDNFEKAVLGSVNGGGDTDTISAITGNISGAYNGYSKIPEQFKQGLVNSGKGRDYLINLAKKLK